MLWATHFNLVKGQTGREEYVNFAVISNDFVNEYVNFAAISNVLVNEMSTSQQ